MIPTILDIQFAPVRLGAQWSRELRLDFTGAKGLEGEKSEMHRYLTAALIVTVGVLLLVRSTVAKQPSEPSYAGKTVNQWLDAGYEDCAAALHEMGPPAAPYVLAKLEHEDPNHGIADIYRRVCVQLPTPVRKLLPRPKAGTFNELRATSMLLELGPSVVSVLAERLKDKNVAVRSACAHALGLLHEQGCDIHKAMPALLEATHDRDLLVSSLASSALKPQGRIAPPTQ